MFVCSYEGPEGYYRAIFLLYRCSETIAIVIGKYKTVIKNNVFATLTVIVYKHILR